MLPDRVSKPGPLTYESVALPIALGGPALKRTHIVKTACYADAHRPGNKYACLSMVRKCSSLDSVFEDQGPVVQN